MPGATTRFPLSVNLHVAPRQTTATALAFAAALGRPDYVAITIVGEIHGHTVDLGVRAEVDVNHLPTTIEELAAAEPVASLIAEFGQRLADLTWHLTVRGLAHDDRIMAGFTVDDVEFLRHCLTNLERRWWDAIDTATASAAQPQRDVPPSPGFVNIEPTPSGYRGIARLAGAELTRVMDYGKRLERLLDLARQAAGDNGDDDREPQ
ncbi:hypothetical protein KIF24_16965 [Micromonospora sp. Llam7]|uniref:hypothetical protein n=1 Tax=Micromonospora tarapacensis TaxID=2835305 RepID=UPI001C831C2E|nr:hypothetical protein [Micromonospora tarapacensis]MBX7267555.1 hypothetical protein [Micromonospora tarapacensis]